MLITSLLLQIVAFAILVQLYPEALFFNRQSVNEENGLKQMGLRKSLPRINRKNWQQTMIDIRKNVQNVFTRDIGLNSIARLLNYALIAALGLYFVIYILHAYQYITYPYQLDYVEGYLLDFANKIAHGETIYNNISNYPFIPGLYPPIYMLICAPFVKIFGLSFMIGRTISVVSALMTAFLIYKIVALKAEKRISFVAALLFFSSPYVFHMTTLFRVDALGLLFCLIGVWFILRYENTKAIFLSIPFFLLAVFTKQSFLVAPAVSLIYLFFKNKRLAIKIAVIFAISVLIIFLIINYITNGQFYIHMVPYQGLSPILHLIIQRYGNFIQDHAIIFGLSLILVIHTTIKRQWWIFSLYFLLAALAALTVGRIGGNINYFLELIAVCCIVSAFVLKSVQFHIRKGTLLGAFVLCLFLMQLALFSHGPFEPLADKLKADQKVSSMIEATQGDILTEDAGLALLNGKELWIEWALGTQLNKLGLWDQSTFVSDLQNKHFALIVLENNARTIYNALTYKGNGSMLKVQEEIEYNQRYTVEMLDAIVKNYNLTDQIGDFYIYKPK